MYMVVTFISVPSTASTIDISLYVCTSTPFLWIRGCFLTLILMLRSPPMWPFPRNFRFAPSSMPLGIVIYSLTLLASMPVPWQVKQGEVILFPSPWQTLQDVLIAIIPCLNVMKPVPWHALHFYGWVPGFVFFPLQVPHVYFLEYSIF